MVVVVFVNEALVDETVATVMLVPVADVNPKNGMEAEVFTVSTVIEEVVNVPWPNESSLKVPFIKRLEPILREPVEVAFTKVVFPRELEVFAMRIEAVRRPFMVEVPAVTWPDEETLNWVAEETCRSMKLPLKRVEVGMFKPTKVPEAWPATGKKPRAMRELVEVTCGRPEMKSALVPEAVMERLDEVVFAKFAFVEETKPVAVSRVPVASVKYRLVVVAVVIVAVATEAFQ